MLDLLLGKQDGTVVAPMTLVEPTYFTEIVGRLRERGHDVRHFALLAERETVLRRLREREIVHSVRRKGVPPKRDNFAVSRLDLCLERLSGAEFGEHLRTDRLTVAQAADRIAESAGLTLEPNTDSAVRGFVRRKWTSVKHIRFG
ncbi:hypothetical protein [Amycolatopsis sp. lyj-112]|uniref:hypothetical protein n=1 Tax=Amycolatopsis sp. lyj-112 TaxID=2789288 RepID=UPI003977FDD8